MGIPWDEDEIGNDCNQFPPGETPKYLWASISGVTRCWDYEWIPSPLNGIWKLTQVEGSACMWQYLDDDVMLTFQLSPTACVFGGGYYWPGWMVFDGLVAGPLIFSFPNLLVCNMYPMPPWFAGGHAIVSRRQPGTAPAIANVAALLNIEQEVDSMADFYPSSDDTVTLKFCRQKTPTNILIKVDYSSFES